VVLVELDEQDDIILLTNMPGVPLDRVAIGLPVVVDFEQIDLGVRIPQFRPASEAGS